MIGAVGIVGDLPWWGYVLWTLGLTHITIAAVTIFLHRNQAHRSVDLSPPVSHFFRLWLWLTTGMNTKEWTAVHRKHHAKVETEDDPHSPQVAGIWKVLFLGAGLYHEETRNDSTMEKYGFGTPDDAMEKFYVRFQNYGIYVMLLADFILFGYFAGPVIWLVQMIWIPFWAAGVINGVGHYLGYRNFQTSDESRNIVPLALFIGGEELHNNHHAYPTSSKLSSRWYEFDLGWGYIRMLEALGLAKVKRIAPRLHRSAKPACDLDTLQSILSNRFEVLAEFGETVKRTCVQEGRKFAATKKGARSLATGVYRKWLSFRTNRLTPGERESLRELMEHSAVMRKIGEMNKELAAIWEDREASLDQLIERLREWCRKAEGSGIESLRNFALQLRGFSSLPQPAA